MQVCNIICCNKLKVTGIALLLTDTNFGLQHWLLPGIIVLPPPERLCVCVCMCWFVSFLLAGLLKNYEENFWNFVVGWGVAKGSTG